MKKTYIQPVSLELNMVTENIIATSVYENTDRVEEQQGGSFLSHRREDNGSYWEDSFSDNAF